MSEDADHPAALNALKWKLLKIDTIKAKPKLMSLNSLCALFALKSEMTNYELRTVVCHSLFLIT